MTEKLIVKGGTVYKIVPEGHEEKENEGVTLVVEELGETALLTEFHNGAIVNAEELTLV